MARVYKDLKTVGWRIKEVSQDSLTLQIKNINGLKRFLKKRNNSIRIGDSEVSSFEVRDKILTYHDSRNDQKANRKFKRYLRKVRKKDLYVNTVFSIELPVTNSSDFTIDFLWKDKPITMLGFSLHQMDLASSLPELEDAICNPLFRRIWKYQDLEMYLLNIQYRNYRPRSKTSVRKTFELYFDHNSSEYNKKDIGDIIRYMQDSNLVIRKAYIKAFASVEGDLENNMNLQRNRAEMMKRLRQKFRQRKTGNS
jgi:hypothetical protein